MTSGGTFVAATLPGRGGAGNGAKTSSSTLVEAKSSMVVWLPAAGGTLEPAMPTGTRSDGGGKSASTAAAGTTAHGRTVRRLRGGGKILATMEVGLARGGSSTGVGRQGVELNVRNMGRR